MVGGHPSGGCDQTPSPDAFMRFPEVVCVRCVRACLCVLFVSLVLRPAGQGCRRRADDFEHDSRTADIAVLVFVLPFLLRCHRS